MRLSPDAHIKFVRSLRHWQLDTPQQRQMQQRQEHWNLHGWKQTHADRSLLIATTVHHTSKLMKGKEAYGLVFVLTHINQCNQRIIRCKP